MLIGCRSFSLVSTTSQTSVELENFSALSPPTCDPKMDHFDRELPRSRGYTALPVWIRWLAVTAPMRAGIFPRSCREPAPFWFLWLIFVSLVIFVVYSMLYPGLGAFGGALDWSQGDEPGERQSRYAADFGPIRRLDVEAKLETFQSDPGLVASAQRIYSQLRHMPRLRCPRSGRPVPRRDADWQSGGNPGRSWTTRSQQVVGVNSGQCVNSTMSLGGCVRNQSRLIPAKRPWSPVRRRTVCFQKRKPCTWIFVALEEVVSDGEHNASLSATAGLRIQRGKRRPTTEGTNSTKSALDSWVGWFAK